jgi:hypothetical protein
LREILCNRYENTLVERFSESLIPPARAIPKRRDDLQIFIHGREMKFMNADVTHNGYFSAVVVFACAYASNVARWKALPTVSRNRFDDSAGDVELFLPRVNERSVVVPDELMRETAS